MKPPTTYVWASNILGHNLCRKILAPTPHFMGYPSVHHWIVFGLPINEADHSLIYPYHLHLVPCGTLKIRTMVKRTGPSFSSVNRSRNMRASLRFGIPKLGCFLSLSSGTQAQGLPCQKQKLWECCRPPFQETTIYCRLSIWFLAN